MSCVCGSVPADLQAQGAGGGRGGARAAAHERGRRRGRTHLAGTLRGRQDTGMVWTILLITD